MRVGTTVWGYAVIRYVTNQYIKVNSGLLSMHVKKILHVAYLVKFLSCFDCMSSQQILPELSDMWLTYV